MTRIHTRTTYSIDVDGVDVPITHRALDYGDPLTHRAGNKLVVAYLVHDHDPMNPMENNDAQGNIYTKASHYARDSSITDNDYELRRALRVDQYGGVDADETCTIDGVKQTLQEHAVDEFMLTNYGHDLTDEWLDVNGKPASDDEDRSITYRDDIERDMLNAEFKEEELQAIVLRLFRENWREIVGPFVVPLSHCSSNHGPGTMTISPTSWDGDPDDLPDGVWVADKDAEENIVAYPPGVAVGQIKGDDGMFTSEYELTENGERKHQGTLGACWDWMKANYTITPADLQRAAEKYAENICSEYQDWCNGNVFGCVVETYINTRLDDDPEWEPQTEESCWGFIGDEWAERALKEEYFEPAVKALET